MFAQIKLLTVSFDETEKALPLPDLLRGNVPYVRLVRNCNF